jgi:hypothetical protein
VQHDSASGLQWQVIPMGNSQCLDDALACIYLIVCGLFIWDFAFAPFDFTRLNWAISSHSKVLLSYQCMEPLWFSLFLSMKKGRALMLSMYAPILMTIIGAQSGPART